MGEGAAKKTRDFFHRRASLDCGLLNWRRVAAWEPVPEAFSAPGSSGASAADST
jgi:hypothetical protein